MNKNFIKEKPNPVDDAEDVVLTMATIEEKEHLPEVCIVEIPSIVLVIETGLGYYTYPMLVIETKMNAEVRDWSSEVIGTVIPTFPPKLKT